MSYFSRIVGISVAAAGVLVGSAVDARAGILDYIWDTSGPAFLGKVFRCRAVSKGEPKCDPIIGPPLLAPTARAGVGPARAWLGLESGVYVSFWKDGKADDGTEIPFGIGHGVAFTFEPILEVRSWTRPGYHMYHGVGVSSIVMASTDFPATGNLGYKFRLAGVEWTNGWSVAGNLRVFPDGFGADQFGVGPPPTGDRPTEYSLGFVVGLPYRFF